jgi:hypothetical protein
VIEERCADDRCGCGDAVRELDILGARCRVSAGMVVDEDESARGGA